MKAYMCPCDFAKNTGESQEAIKPIGLADDILYRTWYVCNHPKIEGNFYVRPCRKNCEPPAAELT